MNSRIDIKALAVRESEQVEWKENVADVNDVVRTLSAFANDLANLGGGYVVCGAKEEKDEHGFARLVETGLKVLLRDLRRSRKIHSRRHGGGALASWAGKGAAMRTPRPL